MFKKNAAIHLVGIGGIGMSALARLLLAHGYRVTGSDCEDSALIEKLRVSGAQITIGHHRNNLGSAQCLVYSSAVKTDNPELVAARGRKIPLFGRSRMLNELMKDKFSIVVSGSHGKTTTTSLIALILERAGLNPSFAIGGEVAALGGNARLGSGNYFVVESDESDGSFLAFRPGYSVVTNIDREHLDYYSDLGNIIRTYRKFVGQTEACGCLFASLDCPRLKEIFHEYPGERVSFSLNEGADFYPAGIAWDGGDYEFDCIASGKNLGRVRLSLPGRHNVANALAAIAAAVKVGVEFGIIQEVLASDWGIKRRFEIKSSHRCITVVEDYAHHPTEISAVLEAARQWHRGRLIVVFQPHRYTRTKHLQEEFATSLSAADYLILADIYPASESPIKGVTTRIIYDRIRKSGRGNVRIFPRGEIAVHLLKELQPDDLVMILGAGDINKVAAELARELQD